MGKDSNFIVIGAEIWCDCGSKPSYLKSGKSSQVGNEYVMLNTHTDPQKNFSNNFGICFGYNNNGNECKMRLLSNWFGSKDDIIYKDYSYQKNVKSYYTHLSNCSKYLVSVLGVIMPQFTTYTGHGVSSNEISNFIRGIGSYNLEIDSQSDALFDIERLQNDIEKTKDYLEKIDPSKLTSRDIVTLSQLQNATDELNSAKSLFNQISSSNEEIGKQLIETSVLICKNGGVIYIKENGQFQENDNFLHGFTPDLQCIYLQGYKYEVYVPPQPQNMTYAELTKDWAKIHSENATHAGINILSALSWGALSDYPSEISTIVDTANYEINLDSAEDMDHPLATGEYSTTHSVDQSVVLPNGKYQKNSGVKTIDYTMNYSPATWQHKTNVIASALPAIIDKIKQNIVRYDVFFDFYTMGSGDRRVIIRWDGLRQNEYYASIAGQTSSRSNYHSIYQKGISEGIEELLIANGHTKAPPYGIPTIGMNQEAIENLSKERKEFIAANPDAEILPDFKSSISEHYMYRYNYKIGASSKRANVGELGYLSYNMNGRLMSTEIIYNDDQFLFGYSRYDTWLSKLIPLLDMKSKLFPVEAYPIYHYLIYNWGNFITNISKRQLKEDFKDIENSEWYK